MNIESQGLQSFNDYRSGAGVLKRIAGRAGGVPGGKGGAFGSMLAGKGGAPRNDKLYEQCVELETFFLKSLVGSMRKTIGKSGLVKSGFAGEMYEDMLYDEYTKNLARNAGFGFAEMAYRELTGARGSGTGV